MGSTKPIDGSYLVWRIKGGNLSKRVGGRPFPKFRHQTFDLAEAEANRLLGEYPDSTFVIMHEVATVKVREQVAA